MILGRFVFLWSQLICLWRVDINTVNSDSVLAKVPELTYASIIRTVPFAHLVLLCCCSLSWQHYLVVFSYSINYAEESCFLIHHLLCSGHEIPEWLSKSCRAGQNLLSFLSRKKYDKNTRQNYRQEFFNLHTGTVVKFS